MRWPRLAAGRNFELNGDVMKYRDFDRTIWLQDIFVENGVDAFPAYPCSSCESGTLKLVFDGLRSWQDAETSRACNYIDFESYVYHFKAELKCVICGEIHNVLGLGEVDDDFDPNGEEIFVEDMAPIMPTRKVLRLNPTNFFPAPPIISLPEKEQDEKFYHLLKKSFSLYWLDRDACANKIRASVEYLLDHEAIDVARWKGATLHQRIEKLKNDHAELFDKFMALKELGNFGSHEFSSLKPADLMDAYQVVDNVIYEMFVFPEIERLRLKRRDQANELAAGLKLRLEKKKDTK